MEKNTKTLCGRREFPRGGFWIWMRVWYNNCIGVLAQLIERRIRIAEVAGLSPAYSTSVGGETKEKVLLFYLSNLFFLIKKESVASSIRCLVSLYICILS